MGNIRRTDTHSAHEAPPFRLARPTARIAPLVVCSPHSGRHYPEAFLAASRLSLAALRRAEDAFVDELFGDAPALGAPLLAALYPRSYLDVNREPYELDPAMFSGAVPAFVNGASPRVRSGFGTVPCQVAGAGAIYDARLPFAEAEWRLATLYRPYHTALTDLIAQARARFDPVIVLDAHSMPSSGGVLGDQRAANLADVVLSDRFGQSCGEAIVAHAERYLRGAGYSIRRNDPYAGGFTTEYYGRPAEGVHTLQIELNRALYWDEARHARHDGFDRLRADMRGLMAALAAVVRPALAAE
ncbi:MAG: N-formylglutamate amidohydrolase [Alphaproteobacteria bacterium]|nr:N-formylglutamate amidohydrolase [Alphaproteobacteria bacterium]